MRMFLKAASVFPLRRHLMMLVVAAIVPVLVFATIMVIVFGRGERASTERGLRDTTRALTLAVDREVETSIKALEALAASLHLDHDDYNMFERHAGRVLPTQPWWRAIVLTDARGEVIMRTARVGARGTRASLAGRPYFVEMTRRLQPALSDVLVDRTTGAPTVEIVVPVIRNGRLRYGLAANLEPAALSGFLASQSLPSDWMGTIIDRDGFVVARSRTPETWLGRPAGALLGRLEGRAGWTRGVDADGVAAYAAYSRSAFTGWTVAIAVPAETVDAPLRGSLLLAVGGGLAVLLGGALLALIVGRRIARPILALVDAAEALGQGRAPTHTASAVSEVNRLAAALEAAARDRDRFERALRDNEAQLRAVFSSTLDAIVVLDDDARAVDANPAAEDLFGVPRERLLGRRLHDAAAPGDVQSLWLGLLSKGSLVGGFRLRRPDGSGRDVELSATAHVLPGRHVAVVRDVTSRRQVEEDLRRREREATAMADLSRRMNEHLDLDGILRLVCETARELCGADSAAIALPETETRDVMALRHRVPAEDPAPDVARLERQPVDVVGVVGAAVEALRRDAEAKGVALDVVLEPGTAVVNGDPVRLAQVVANLVSNAIKFTPPGGRVAVELSHPPGEAIVTVRDTGAGIEASLLPHVFDRFRQGQRGRGTGGLGLGLAIVRHIVTLHGGTVTAHSDGPGRGAAFTVTLPLSREPRLPIAGAGPRATRAARPLEGIRILAVDDHPDARELVRVALTDRGADVRTAASVSEALAALEDAAIDVLVSDLGMPGADGFALVAQLRERERTDRRPPMVAIALTAYASPTDRTQALAAGFDLHVAKPVDPDALTDAVVGALERARRLGRRVG